MADQADIIESLAIDDVPIKLRCAACNKLALDAVRMPCCDQNICADCQANRLETTCPICYHEPINADDCRPNKALRQTIKVFLKKKIIERDNARKLEAAQKAAAETPVNPPEPTDTEANVAAVEPTDATPAAAGDLANQDHDRGDVDKDAEEPIKQEDSTKDIPQPSIESPGPEDLPRRASTVTLDNEEKTENADEGGSRPKAVAAQNDPSATAPGQGMNGANFDPNFMASMGLNMNDMNPMMLQMMQNGMANPMMSGFPNMMNMAGMAMDPMAFTQGMFNNFGGPGMMNGMNMGMGFDAGQGAMGGGFNGQPQGAWNSSGQNKFNQNGYMGGNYNANAGYGTGYNMPQQQGNFNHVHHANYPQNDFHQHGHHNQGFYRGRGRGRGGHSYASRGRGNFHQVNHNFDSNYDSSQQVPEGPVRRGSPVYTPMNGEKGEPTSTEDPKQDQVRDEFAPGDAEDRADEEAALNAKTSNAEAEADSNKKIPSDIKIEPEDGADRAYDAEDGGLNAANGDDVEFKSAPPNQVAGASVQNGNTLSAMLPPPSPSVSNGIATTSAPSLANPAHEQGQSLHGRGFTRIPQADNAGNARMQQPEKPFQPPAEPRGLGVVGAPTGPKAMRQKQFHPPNKQDPGISIFGRAAAARTEARHNSPHRSRSRSRSPLEQSSARSHRRHGRSRSPAEEDQVDERKERYRRSRKHEEEYAHEGDADYKRSKPSRTRDSSIESSKKSSRRDRRERDYEKDKSSRRSGRSHRHEDSDTEERYHKKSHHHHASDRDGKDISSSSKPHRSSHHHRSYDKEEDDPTSSSSSKRRRSRDEYEEDLDDTEREHHHNSSSSRHHHHHHHRSSKRSKPSSSSHNADSSSSSKPFAPPTGPASSSSSIPTGPRAAQSPPSAKPDSHALEREKRDRERQMKELQRRALAHPSGSSGWRQSDSSRRASTGGAGDEGGGGGGGGEGGIRINGAAARRGSRKISVRYEDELEGLR